MQLKIIKYKGDKKFDKPWKTWIHIYNCGQFLTQPLQKLETPATQALPKCSASINAQVMGWRRRVHKHLQSCNFFLRKFTQHKFAQHTVITPPNPYIWQGISVLITFTLASSARTDMCIHWNYLKGNSFNKIIITTSCINFNKMHRQS